MQGVWRIIHSFFNDVTPRRRVLPSRIPIVALVVSAQDRYVLSRVSGQEPLETHFVESCEEACAVANQSTAPVILCDRDWPGTEWRVNVQSLATLPHWPCVVLMSGVCDNYLLQEVIRRGGYDVLPKPLRADSVVRVVKLAVSYRNSSPRSTTLTRRS